MTISYQRDEVMPEPDERRAILERAARVLQQARDLSATLDEVENRLSWCVEDRGDSHYSLAFLPGVGPQTPRLRLAAKVIARDF